MLNSFLVLGQVPGTNIFLNFWEITSIALALAVFALVRYRRNLTPYYAKSWQIILKLRARLGARWHNRLAIQLKLFE